MKRPLITATQIILCCLFAITGLTAQADVWKPIKNDDLPFTAERRIVPNKMQLLEADILALQALLHAAPHELDVAPGNSSIELTLPNPKGEPEIFKIVAYDMMEPALREEWDFIHTWRGVSSKNPLVTIRLDWTARGFHAMVLDGADQWFVDPYFWEHNTHYQSYYKRDYPQPEEVFECGVQTEEGAQTPGSSSAPAFFAGDCELQTYRLANACTGEYTAFHGGTVAGAASAIATTLNRTNGIYEMDLAIRLILVANNNSIIYTDGATDPYTNNSGGVMLNENQANLDVVIGTANYDIGHVFSTGGGGIAQLRSPCTSGGKARGVTGLGNPVGDPFDVDYVAHEVGHQFGGNHPQNNNCQRSSASMEPGSASTIMGYAGICAPNIQSNSDAYYHGISIQEIADYMQIGGGNGCATVIAPANDPPTITTPGLDYIIPASTPFVLTASASDPNGDALTYNWEQWDPEVGSCNASGSN